MPDCSLRPKKEQPLPLVLSPGEVGAILSTVKNTKHRLALLLIYSAGLRVSEAVNLELKEIDYAQKIITIRQGKGKKDRQVPLSVKLETLISEYFREYSPGRYLLEGQKGGKYSVRSIQAVFYRACRSGGYGSLRRCTASGTASRLIYWKQERIYVLSKSCLVNAAVKPRRFTPILFRPVRLQGYVRRRTIWILRGDTENCAVLLYILDLCSDNSGFWGYIGGKLIVMYTQVCAYVGVDNSRISIITLNVNNAMG